MGLLLLHLLLAPAADQSELSIAARLHQSQLTWCRAGPCPRTGAAPPRATATAGCSPATPGHSPRPRQPRTRCHAALATRNILCQMLWCNFEKPITLSVSVLGRAVRGEGVPPGHPEGVHVAGLRVARAQEGPRPPPLLTRGRARGRPLVENLVVSGGLAADAAVPRGGAQLRRGQRRGRVPAPTGAPAVLGGPCDGANTTFSAAGDIQLSVTKSRIPLLIFYLTFRVQVFRQRLASAAVLGVGGVE